MFEGNDNSKGEEKRLSVLDELKNYKPLAVKFWQP